MAEPFVVHINPSTAPQTQAHEHGSSIIQSLGEHLLLQLRNPSTQSAPNHGSNQLQNQGSNHEPKQTHNLNSMAEQFVLQIGQSSTGPPASTTPSSTLNLKVVEPILLHINSLITTPSPPPTNPINTATTTTKGQPSDSDPSPAAGHTQQGPDTPPNKALKKHQKVLNQAGSLANLLPTGTVLAFQAITPSLSYNGNCHVFNYYLVAFVILVCSVVCFLSSFIDSTEHNEKVYYGIATSKGLWVFNYEEDSEDKDEEIQKKLARLKIHPSTDFVHAFVSVFVFLIFAFSSSEVQDCYFPRSIRDHLEYSLVIYLPLLAGLFSTLLFTIYPAKRRGIGYTPTGRA